MLFLPENCCLFCETARETLAAVASPASPSFDEVLEPYRALARETGLWLSLGGVQEKIENADEGEDEGDRTHNTHVVLRADGSTAGACYRKIHLFDVGPLRESAATRPGDSGLVVVGDAPCGPLGLSICYDLRFPELYQRLRFDMGARVLAVPAAFTRATGGAGHWRTLLRARAVETQCFVVAAAQAGVHNKNEEGGDERSGRSGERSGRRASWGETMVIDAWGKVLAEMKSSPEESGSDGGNSGGKEEQPEEEREEKEEDLVGIVVVDLTPETVEDVRRRMPLAEHREAGRRQLSLALETRNQKK